MAKQVLSPFLAIPGMVFGLYVHDYSDQDKFFAMVDYNTGASLKVTLSLNGRLRIPNTDFSVELSDPDAYKKTMAALKDKAARDLSSAFEHGYSNCGITLSRIVGFIDENYS